MFSTGAIFTVLIIGLLIGFGVGFFFSRIFGSFSGNSSSLKQKLAETEQQLEKYQAEVTEHFMETSRRVNALTKNYKEVHEYLAAGAAKLANPEMVKNGFAAQITLDEHQRDVENIEIIAQDIDEADNNSATELDEDNVQELQTENKQA